VHLQLSPPYTDPGWFGQFLFEGSELVSAGGLDEGVSQMLPIYQRMFDSVEQAHVLAGRDSDLDVNAMRGVGEKLIEAADGNFTDVMQLVRYPDYDTFTVGHSVRVASIAVLVGHGAGMAREQQIELAAAAMLHDVGKSKIPDEILYKADGLDDDERRLVERHPRARRPDPARESRSDPHADCRGVRPPPALRGRRLSGAAQLRRLEPHDRAAQGLRRVRGPDRRASVQSAMSARAAYEVMLQDRGSFEPGAFRALVRAMGIYPPGSRVLLSNGERGVVAKAGVKIDRPLVRISHDPAGKPLEEARTCDLGALGNLRVVRSLPDRSIKAREQAAPAAPALCAHTDHDPATEPTRPPDREAALTARTPIRERTVEALLTRAARTLRVSAVAASSSGPRYRDRMSASTRLAETRRACRTRRIARCALAVALATASCAVPPAQPSTTAAWLERFADASRFLPAGMQSHWFCDYRGLPSGDGSTIEHLEVRCGRAFQSPTLVGVGPYEGVAVEDHGNRGVPAGRRADLGQARPEIAGALVWERPRNTRGMVPADAWTAIVAERFVVSASSEALLREALAQRGTLRFGSLKPLPEVAPTTISLVMRDLEGAPCPTKRAAGVEPARRLRDRGSRLEPVPRARVGPRSEGPECPDRLLLPGVRRLPHESEHRPPRVGTRWRSRRRERTRPARIGSGAAICEASCGSGPGSSSERQATVLDPARPLDRRPRCGAQPLACRPSCESRPPAIALLFTAACAAPAAPEPMPAPKPLPLAGETLRIDGCEAVPDPACHSRGRAAHALGLLRTDVARPAEQGGDLDVRTVPRGMASRSPASTSANRMAAPPAGLTTRRCTNTSCASAVSRAAGAARPEPRRLDDARVGL
jgi:hypothetical protein